jgi:hypothetical protein
LQKKKNVKKEKIQALTKFFIKKLTWWVANRFGRPGVLWALVKPSEALSKNIQRSYSIFFLLDASGGNN